MKKHRIEFIAVTALWLGLWPLHTYISLWLSYPMRRIAAEVVTVLLEAMGFSVMTENTAIYLEGSSPIVIADACSGVEGLIALVFIGWILARLMQKSFAFALVHYLFALPAIVFANVVRLVITALGFRWFGQVVLDSTCHNLLGYFQLMLAFGFFYLAGLLIRKVS